MRHLFTAAWVLALNLPAFCGQISEADIEAFKMTYFAPLSILPCGVWRMKTPDGGIRLFACPWNGEIQLKSSDGWLADTDGVKSWVMTPPGASPALKIGYEDGRPVSLEVDGVAHTLERPGAVVYGDAVLPAVRWPDFWAEKMNPNSRSLFDRRWSWVNEFNRLRLWFEGPNQAGALFAMLLVLMIAIAFRARCVVWRIFWSTLALLPLAGILLTQSRGSLVAAFAAVCLVTICHFHACGMLTRRRIVLIVLALALAGGLGGGAFALASNRGGENYRSSNEYRTLLWKTFPRIMCDAPWGWGSSDEVGAAYTNWYSSPDDWTFRRNLVNDYFTTMASFGWLGGGLYLLAWLVGLMGLFRLAWKGGPSVPMAIWSVVAITAFFNSILEARTILWLPILSLGLLFSDRRWRTVRFWGLPFAGGLICTGAILLAIYCAGGLCEPSPSVCRRGGAVLLNGNRPKTWISVDYDVLGSVFMTREEIREQYSAEGDVPSLGLVADLDELPADGIRRLVLSGRHCAEFLRRHAADGFRRGIPSEIVFLSPGFSAAAIPPELHARARVRVVMGEFAARYYPDMANPPDWATVVKGAEVYIPGWLRHAISAD